MLDRRMGVFLSALAVAFAMQSCSKKEAKKSGGDLKTNFQSSRISQAALNKSSLALAQVLPSKLSLTSSAFSRSEGSDLESLSYRLQSITLCGKLAAQGSGGQCDEGPLSIYSSPNLSTNEYDTFLPENAALDTTNFTNVLDKDALKKLASGITYNEGHIRSYDSVLVNWFRPFKVKSSMAFGNGTRIYTKTPTEYRSNGESGLNVKFEAMVSDITTGPAEEATFFLPNGGTYFKLGKPFEITQADVDNKVAFKIVFAFDPDSIISGSTFVSSPETLAQSWIQGMADHALGYRMDAPFLQIAPVVARESETVMREVYLLRSSDSTHDVRVSIYYIKEDPDTVRATTSTTINYDVSPTPVTFHQAYAVEKNAEGTYDFKDWMGKNVIGGLKRSSTPGQVEGTVSHTDCAPGSTAESSCSAGTVTTQYTYSLVAVGSVESDLTIGYQPQESESGSGTP